MLFNLVNASVIFQLYINTVLQDLLNIFYMMYFNDIFIFLKNKKEHTAYIKEMLKRLH